MRYEFTIASEGVFKNRTVDVARFEKEIRESAITVALASVAIENGNCVVVFKDDLTEDEVRLLNELVRDHTGEPMQDPRALPPSKNVIGAVGGVGTGDYSPSPYERQKGMHQDDVSGLNQDGDGNLETRGAVFTDEGSFRDDFAANPMTQMTGTVTFQKDSCSVIGTDTKFLEELDLNDYIKLEVDANTTFRKVVRLVSDTEIDVDEPATATRSGPAIKSAWITDTHENGQIEFGNSFARLILGSQAGDSAMIFREADYLPLSVSFYCRLSRRIPGQSFAVGFVDNPYNPQTLVVAIADGADPSRLKLVSMYKGLVEESEAKMPDGGSTELYLEVEVAIISNKATLSVNGQQICVNKRHLPSKYDTMYLAMFARNWTAIPQGGNTIWEIDYIDFVDHNILHTDEQTRKSWDGRTEVRIQPARLGARLREKIISFYTAKPDSLHNVGPEGPLTDVIYTMMKPNAAFDPTYDPASDGGAHLEKLSPYVSTTVPAEATVTIIDFMPPYDYEIMSGGIYIPKSLVDGETDQWYGLLVGVPDIPQIYGGSVDFLTETNFEACPQFITFDGRATTLLEYHPEMPILNKLRLLIKHPAGASKRFQLFLDTFR